MALPDKFCIISGGQTGADRAALDFAIRAGIPHDGWCPRGRLAEDGPLPSIYELKETDSKRYDVRTRRNVRDADATLVLTIDAKPSGGTELTIEVAARLGKPCLHISRDNFSSLDEASRQVQHFIAQHNVVRLNVAGPRESQQPEVASFVGEVLTAALVTAENVSTESTQPQS